MKKQEEIIISKQLAIDLIWWLENASAPCLTIREVQERWYQLFSDPQLTLARDSMKAELEKALAAKKRWVLEYDPLGLESNEPDSFEEYKRNFHKGHRYLVRNSVRPHAWHSEGWDG